MNIATVVEGPTDRLVLKAIINHLYPGEHRYFDLQPIGSDTFGETGTGWKGVRNWCRQTWQRQDSSLSKVLSEMAGPPLDLLVIHIDADIATASDLQAGLPEPLPIVQTPCPPVLATIDNLRLVITRWLNFNQFIELPPQVLITVPAQDMENWIFAALYPNDELCQSADYGCTHTSSRHPGYRLTLSRYGKLLSRKDGTIKKSQHRYQAILPQFVENWAQVCRICTQAQQFAQELHAKLVDPQL